MTICMYSHVYMYVFMYMVIYIALCRNLTNCNWVLGFWWPFRYTLTHHSLTTDVLTCCRHAMFLGFRQTHHTL